MYGSCKVLAVVTLMAAMLFGGITALGDPAPHTPWLAAAAAMACTFCCAFVAYTQNRRGLPNVLATQFGKDVLSEADGVQFAVLCPEETPPGAQFRARVFVQNCWDAPREVTFRVTNDETLLGRLDRKLSGAPSQPLSCPPAMTVALGPSSVGCFDVPIGLHPGASGRQRGRIHVRVAGTEGSRVLHWRAPHSAHPVPDAVTNLLVFFGVFWAEGGTAVEVKAKASAPIDPHATDMTGPVWFPNINLDWVDDAVPAHAQVTIESFGP